MTPLYRDDSPSIPSEFTQVPLSPDEFWGFHAGKCFRKHSYPLGRVAFTLEHIVLDISMLVLFRNGNSWFL